MNNTGPILSICIPTYNRADTVLDLIYRLLKTESDSFDIVVTNNVSTDHTKKSLSAISDHRVKVIDNAEPIPALNNMIEALYNADGKYALYCNDRDLITNNGLVSLINFLQKDDFSFVYTTPLSKENSNKITIYNNAFSSLIGHRCGYHPTGMVFNIDIAKERLKKEKYFQYLKDQNTYCFLMRDLFAFGKTAIIDNGCWSERSREYLSRNPSGTVVDKNLFFYPDLKLLLAKDTIDQIRSNRDFNLSGEELRDACIYSLNHYGESLLSYKSNLMSKFMTNHYGIKRRFVSMIEMIRITERYHTNIHLYLKEKQYPEQIVSVWKSTRKSLYKYMIASNVKIDAIILLHFIKHQPY